MDRRRRYARANKQKGTESLAGIWQAYPKSEDPVPHFLETNPFLYSFNKGIQYMRKQLVAVFR